jgi:iron complex transport system substrate-binding protein
MSEDGHDTSTTTRRDVVKYGGALLAGSALAGCTGAPESQSDTTTAATTASPTHSVTMEPVGTVEFDTVPETWVPFTGDYADMGVALGQADGMEGIGLKGRYAAHLYEELPGVSVDEADLAQLWQDRTGKEIFLELDADVHVIDPNFMINRLQWTEGDVVEIRETVAPFVGNTSFTRAYEWHDYRYYSMYEALEKLATLFDERERYEAFRDYHDAVLAAVEDRLPDRTPEVAVLVPADTPPESFWPYRIGQGTQSKHWNDLGVADAFDDTEVADAQAGGGRIDYERLLSIDPDVIAIRRSGETTQGWVDENVTAHMEDHPVAGDLRAVQDDRVVYGGRTYQGPIIHLFQLETVAQGLYPDAFGGEELFDRDRVAEIVRGEG